MPFHGAYTKRDPHFTIVIHGQLLQNSDRDKEIFMKWDVQHLPKGGWLASLGESTRIQHMSPPETIKDTMLMEKGVPGTYLIGSSLCDPQTGVCTAELEFPAYFNFFARQQRTRIICTPDQAKRILTIFETAVFGPEVAPDSEPGIHSVLQEMDYFRSSPFGSNNYLESSDFLEFLLPGPDGIWKIGNLKIKKESEHWCLSMGKHSIQLPCDPPIPLPAEESSPKVRFEPPAFGITVIGSGHGFDARTKTCGLLIWGNHKGILVDPPIDTTHWIQCMQLNASQIHSLILTHCHADHDAGTLQKILEEGIIELYTTRAIHEAFIAKGIAMTGMSREEFTTLYNFNPVQVGEPIWIEGVEFRFRWSLHSVPTIGFEAFHAMSSFVYTSDHLLAPETYQELHQSGRIDQKRLQELMNFPWHHPVIFHEAGVPPLHTPLSTLEALPLAIRRRIQLLHVSPSQVRKDSGLKIAVPGLENTIVLKEKPSARDKVARMIELLGRSPLFCQLSFAKASEFLSLLRVQKFKSGETIIEKGSEQKDFYLILKGEVEIHVTDREESFRKYYQEGDYIGETAIVLGIPRTADVTAHTDVECACLGEYQFLYFIRGTGIEATIRQLHANRLGTSWDVLQECAILATASSTLKNHLQSMIVRQEIKKGTILSCPHKIGAGAWLMESGVIEVQQGETSRNLKRSQFVLDRRQFDPSQEACTITVTENSIVWHLSREDLNQVIRDYPGLSLRLTPQIQQDMEPAHP